MTTWRDDEAHHEAVIAEDAVAAYKRWLAREIENLPAPDEDGIYVWALDVLAMLDPENTL